MTFFAILLKAQRSHSCCHSLGRNENATVDEIVKAASWQNHPIRRFISGTLTKKMGVEVESTKNEAGQRTYRIV